MGYLCHSTVLKVLLMQDALGISDIEENNPDPNLHAV